MRRARRFLLSVMTALLLSGLPLVSQALEATQVSKTLRITYVEPTTNADGSPLDDLQGTVIRWSIDGVAQPEIGIPATALTGGGAIQHEVTVPFTPNTLAHVALDVVGVDTHGNISETVVASTVIDWLPPGKVK